MTHTHIWDASSGRRSLRCIECKRYLQPIDVRMRQRVSYWWATVRGLL